MLLFDHNLSVRLVAQLADLFPDARHVAQLGLERATDEQIWSYAATHGCTIVTKDSDFSDLSVLRGTPPQVIWLRLGNCTTAEIEALLRRHGDTIRTFLASQSAGTLVVR
jgi:predicted nuclease of predicted toxin-antitoxin system